MSAEGESRIWQKLVGGLAALVLVASVGVFVSGKSIEDILFGAEEGSHGRVGTVALLDGTLKRQPKDSLEFLGARQGEGVFNEDTVMTGARDSATLGLNDGGKIEMGPNTLIRLSFETLVSMQGIERQVAVDVVEGQVNAEATNKEIVIRSQGRKSSVPRGTKRRIEAPVEENRSAIPAELRHEAAPTFSPTPEPTPSPEPSPTPEPSPEPPPPPPQPMALAAAPLGAGGAIAIPAAQTPPFRTAFRFSSANGLSGPVQATTYTASGKRLSAKTVAMKDGEGSVPLTFTSPGTYRIELQPTDPAFANEPPVATTFVVPAEFVGIRIEPPLVGDRPISSNRYIGRNMTEFDVKLRWWDYPEATRYQVELRDARGKVLVSDTTDSTAYSFKKDHVYVGKLFYKVSAPLPSGFVATSGENSFTFDFASPPLTEPADGDTVSAAAGTRGGKGAGILFTWQRTNFTQSYDFEIAADPAFARIVKRVNVKENFLIFRGLKPATYYWRVRARAGDVESEPEKPFRLVVTP